jgi:hypothetical protein
MGKRFNLPTKVLIIAIFLFSFHIFNVFYPKGESAVALNENTEDVVIKDFTLDDLAIVDLGTNEKITMGMTKTEVEKALGVPNAINKREYSVLLEYDFSGLFVIYRNEKVVNLRVNENVSSDPYRFSTYRNVAIGDDAESIFTNYNDFVSNEQWVGCMLYDGESGLAVIDKSEAGKYNPENVYGIYFAKSMSDKIYLITILDYKNKVTFN